MTETLLELARLKRRMLILMAGVLLLSAGLVLFINWYQAPAITRAQTRWNDLRQQVALAGKFDVTAAYRQGKSDLDAVRGRIPLKRQFPRVLGDLLDAAAASGVATGAVSYRPESVKDENLLAYRITMNVSGGYAAVKSFLADLSGIRELVVIDGLTMSNTDYFGDSPNMTIKLTVYLREGGA